MLSQVKRRLLYPSFAVSNFLEGALITPSVSHFYSSPKYGRGKRPDVSEEISEKMKPQNKSDGLDSLFGDSFEDLSAPSEKKIVFKKRTSGQNFSNMKPRQLNQKMVQAAKDVTAEAGVDRPDLLHELLEKLNSDFPVRQPMQNKRIRNSNNKGRGLNIIGPNLMNDLFDTLAKNNDDNNNKIKPEGVVARNFLDGLTANQNKEEMRKALFTLSEADELFDHEGNDPDDFHLHSNLKNSAGNAMGKKFKTIEEYLFSHTPLNIFSSNLKAASGSSMDLFQEIELRRSISFEPLNWFDQCITWTEEGKLWHFPIDNEQGMDEEAQVDFTEHIFLESYAESWCPKEGPIRHFMELVFVGLSKNPFLTVAEKKETIEWYHQYFTKHQALLEEINAFGSVQKTIEVEGKLA